MKNVYYVKLINVFITSELPFLFVRAMSTLLANLKYVHSIVMLTIVNFLYVNYPELTHPADIKLCTDPTFPDFPSSPGNSTVHISWFDSFRFCVLSVFMKYLTFCVWLILPPG